MGLEAHSRHREWGRGWPSNLSSGCASTQRCGGREFLCLCRAGMLCIEVTLLCAKHSKTPF